MKNYLITFLLLSSLYYSQAQEIEWLSWEEAITLSDSTQQPKKILVFIYTDWCGWCKKMDKDTFKDPELVNYLNDHFYNVRLNAESKEDIHYKGTNFQYITQGRRGYHQLAAALLQGQLSFPNTVVLNEQQEILAPIPGYYNTDGYLKITKYFGDDIFKDLDWETYDNKS